MIQITDLTMNYGDFCALDHLNLDIKKGEFFAFLGPNGAGKTTTIKILTGLLSPTEGKAELCGYDIATHPLEAKKRIGYIPDVAEFYDKLTPREFMEFIGELFEVNRAESPAKTSALFDRFDLHQHAAQRIENLSHGTRQRLAIASALLHEPEVIVIDEPMVGLDPRNARVVKEELKQRSIDGTTIFLSTHLLNVAEELADRIGIINGGKLLALGTVDELRDLASDRSLSLEEIFLELTERESFDVEE